MAINTLQDTITAITTPLGTGGVGVIRISGEKSIEIISKIFSISSKTKKLPEFIPSMAYHGWIKANNKLIDEVLVLYFKAPKSFTGEDVVEIHCHGGINVVKNILNIVLDNGARLAERGEFTKRAFLNQKMDLSEAEAVLDIINAKTDKFSEISAQNLSGKLALNIKNLRKEIMDVLSRIIGALDFPEDMPEPEYNYLEEKTNDFITQIEQILKTAHSSNLMRQGIQLAIIGKPNVGKSSLFNALLSFQRAIVTDIPGTTRDVIQETLDIGGIPITLIDTAGIRDEKHADSVEKIGINLSKQYLKNADIVIFLYDLTKGRDNEDNEVIKDIPSNKLITVGSKSDILSNTVPVESTLHISSKTGDGIEVLRQVIENKICSHNSENSEFSTNQRQQECLKKAQEALVQAINGIHQQELQDLISIDYKSALLALDEITGEVITDDILNNIFENFCIGK